LHLGSKSKEKSIAQKKCAKRRETGVRLTGGYSQRNGGTI